MAAWARMAAVLAAPLLTGCLSVSFGGGGGGEPTMASEIRELKRLRWQGTISREEFERGKLAVLNNYGEASLDLGATQIAEAAEPEPPTVR